MHPAVKKGATAVITGAASGGIGASLATKLSLSHGVNVVLADISLEGISKTSESIKAQNAAAEVLCVETDVSSVAAMRELERQARDKYGKIDLLFLNAGIGMPTKDYGEDFDAWHKTFAVNFYGVLNGTQVFVDKMIKQDTSAAVVVTGSKQGITCPPGNPAYNTSKAAVKALTESLAHSLIPTKVSAHLLVPGYTFTKITTGGAEKAASEKPEEAWTADQVADECLNRMASEFYIICPDNSVSWELDSARMAWNVGDILEKRPALSRWHPDYEAQFQQFVASRVKK